jgi:pyrimidine operon attenuation protein/uracil phosphoribosyltransferase
LAKRLSQIIKGTQGVELPIGALDVSFYRDDLSKKGKYITIRRSDMPFPITDKIVIFVDDVIYAGRTACAALDGLKDYGRPAKVQIAALVDRGHREMPIHADFVGREIPTDKDQNVQVELVEIDGVDRVLIK